MLLARSHPSWVCGLKLELFTPTINAKLVTPFVGVWIETHICVLFINDGLGSHPSWVCGLKRDIVIIYVSVIPVTPFVGVWIET